MDQYKSMEQPNKLIMKTWVNIKDAQFQLSLSKRKFFQEKERQFRQKSS